MAAASSSSLNKWLLWLALPLMGVTLIVLTEQRAILTSPWMLHGPNGYSFAEPLISLVIRGRHDGIDQTAQSPEPYNLARSVEDETTQSPSPAPPKPCASTRTENAKLVSSDVPESMATLTAITGVADPLKHGRMRKPKLPWRRENWCATSPCLTVTNATQRATEIPHFEWWLKEIRYAWSNTFDPRIFRHDGGVQWYVPTQMRNSTLYLRNATHGFTYMDTIAPLENATSCEHFVDVPDGDTLLLWYSFHRTNYGHFIHDHAPSLVALFDLLGSSISWLALPESELAADWLCWFDPALLKRVVFYPAGKVVCTKATTMIPLSRRGEGGGRFRLPGTVSLLNQKAHERHYRPAARPKIVFASRNSTTAKHGRALVNEQEVLDTVRRMMELYKRPEELVVYNGDGVSYADQFALFSTASVIMGPHGSAMSNVLWSRSQDGCQDPVQVIEFVGSRVSGPLIQSEYHGYYVLEASVPWVSYHMVTFQEGSTRAQTFVNPADVESVLSLIWGNRKTDSTKCYPGLVVDASVTVKQE